MLTRLDDYLVHQTPSRSPTRPPAIATSTTATSSTIHPHRRPLFRGGARPLPNRRVMDAAFSMVRDGVQYVVRASRLAPSERTETRVGPLAIEVAEPLRALRVRVAPNPHGIEATSSSAPLRRHRGAAIHPPRPDEADHGLDSSDAIRQLGGDARRGRRAPHGRTVGRARHTRPLVGIRPVGEPEGGAPGMPPQFFWLWAPVHSTTYARTSTSTRMARGGAGTPTATSSPRQLR